MSCSTNITYHVTNPERHAFLPWYDVIINKKPTHAFQGRRPMKQQKQEYWRDAYILDGGVEGAQGSCPERYFSSLPFRSLVKRSRRSLRSTTSRKSVCCRSPDSPALSTKLSMMTAMTRLSITNEAMMRNEQKNTAATAVCVMNNKLSTGLDVNMTIMPVMPKISSTDHTFGILSWILT